MRLVLIPLALAATVVSGCATNSTSFPVEVTRFRADEVGRGTVSIESDSTTLDGLRFQTYANAVADALTAQGYTVVPAGQPAKYVARIGLMSERRPVARRDSGASIGVGGGGYSGGYRGGGVGIGLGFTIPIGRPKPRDRVATILNVKINTREGNLGVWEGTARTQEDVPAGTGDDTRTAPRLATALFTGFPGESGRTIEVK